MWDIRYRPLRYADVLGQAGSIQLLKSRIKNGSAFDVSYIFSGRHGGGKTTLARIHARAMLCPNINKADPEPCNECGSCKSFLMGEHPAFSERDAASNNKTEHARAIVAELPFTLDTKRIFLLDEAHRLTSDAQDVLLKPVEEKLMVAMLCTTEPDKIRGPIRSRSEEYRIQKVTRDNILGRMQYILTQEGVIYEDQAVIAVIDHSKGHVRDIINTLEMVAQVGPITLASVQEYLRTAVSTLYYQLLLNLDSPLEAMTGLHRILEYVRPEEVANGIAQAAMTSFYLGNRIPSEVSNIDLGLAEKVYAKYQNHVVRFAQWFTEERYFSKVGLETDILAFTLNPGGLPQGSAQPPIMLASVSSQPAAPKMADSATVSVPATPPVVSQFSTPVPSPADPYEDHRDPTIATETESPAVTKPKPRQREDKGGPVYSGLSSTRPKPVQMLPQEWSALFWAKYKKKAPRG